MIPLSSEQQDAIVDRSNQLVAEAEDRRTRVRTKEEKLQFALETIGEIPPLTEHDRAVLRGFENICACHSCRAIFPYTPEDDGKWFMRDSCPRCERGLFAAIRVRGQRTDLNNPYLEDVLSVFKGANHPDLEKAPELVRHGLNTMVAREVLTDRYAWAIPDEQAIDMIAKYGPIVEIGAGRGYWAWLLSQRGVEVAAFDKEPPPNHYHCESDHLFYPVKKAGPEQAGLKKYRDHALFLCWPPYSDGMAFEALSRYRGRHIIYIGERGGCTGCGNYATRLDRDWEMIDDLDIPQWGGVHDCLMVYKRK